MNISPNENLDLSLSYYERLALPIHKTTCWLDELLGFLKSRQVQQKNENKTKYWRVLRIMSPLAKYMAFLSLIVNRNVQ